MLWARPDFRGTIVNFDALTYAGNLESLADVAARHGGTRYSFVKADICDRAAVEAAFSKHAPDAVVHFAAESHVDRSIAGPRSLCPHERARTFTVLDRSGSRLGRQGGNALPPRQHRRSLWLPWP